MREIKFRVWDTRLKDFQMGNEVLGLSFEDMVAAHIEIGKPLPKTAILMQWTGLLDRNSKEIYEGDIVFDQLPNGDSWTCPVEYKEGCYYPIGMEKYAVVGNIYQNKNLLK